VARKERGQPRGKVKKWGDPDRNHQKGLSITEKRKEKAERGAAQKGEDILLLGRVGPTKNVADEKNELVGKKEGEEVP